MKPVVQLEPTGCGIASVAALAGVSYTAAKRVANRMGISATDADCGPRQRMYVDS